MGHAFVVEYKKGKDNLVADALSRKVDIEDGTSGGVSDAHDRVLCMVSFPSPAWLTDLKSTGYFSSFSVGKGGSKRVFYAEWITFIQREDLFRGL